MHKPLTILDIARLSGVGKSTVSRVLNQDPKVKDETRERVNAVIREHGFEPSKSARSMRTRSPRLIGIIVSRLDSASENRSVRGILETLYARGYDAMLMESEFSPDKTDEHLALLARRGVDGLILFAFTGLDLDKLADWRDRLVLIARPWPGLASVCHDDEGAIALMLQHLLAQGLRHIGFVGVHAEDVTTGGQRLAGYLRVCTEQGLEPHYALGELDYQSGYQLAARLLQPQTQALVCATDTIALGVAKYLQEVGRADVVVTGVGNNALLRFLFPKVMSVDLGYKRAGHLAAEQLLAQIESGAAPCQLQAPSQLVE
ncbi:trehalose operon repressor TreR [Pseudaeromonas sp. ZJS20]|uniref:trehalose operon repressor TreR n=1 Tax=Pseudaeromonas aegiceratis TaxID=3153928 RepID=UPI00390C75C3